MLEIIGIIFLGKKIKEIVTEKGLSPTGYIIILVILWIGLEIIGSIIGIMLFGEGLMLFVFAILGGALGAFISYNIATAAKPAPVELQEISS